MGQFIVGLVSICAIFALSGRTSHDWQWYAICAALIVHGVNYSIE